MALKARKFTEADRQKGVETRKAKAAAMQHYKRDWLDSPVWEELARLHGIRLPVWNKAPTARALKAWHGRWTNAPFEFVYGCSARRLIQLNPRQPLRAFVGQMLERGAG